MRAIRGQFLKFLVGGSINTAVTYGLFVALCQVMSPSVAYTITYLVGILLSYLINAYFVFRARVSLGSMLQFPIVYVIQYLFGLALLSLLTNLGLESHIAMLAVIVASVPLTFILTRFIFKNTKVFTI